MSRDPLRILFWTESFWPRIGGSEVATSVLIEGLRRRGHECAVVTRQWADDQPSGDDWRGVPIHRVPFDDATFDRLDHMELLPLRQRIVKFKRAFNADLVHVGLTGPSLFLHNFTAGQFPVPTLVTMHVAPVATEYGHNKPVGETLKTATSIVPVSEALREQLETDFPAVRGKCGVIHNALPESPNEPVPVTFDPPRLLCVGRATEQKGFDTAIAVMPRVLERHPDTQLDIVGDGDALESLKQRARDLGVASRVSFHGWQPPEAIEGWHDRATLVLMPSRWEPFGLVALQAAQRARVCIASDVDGLPEVVEDGSTGFLRPPDDPEAWAVTINDLLGDRALVTAIGERGRRIATERFSVDRHVDAYETLYRRLIRASSMREAHA